MSSIIDRNSNSQSFAQMTTMEDLSDSLQKWYHEVRDTAVSKTDSIAKLVFSIKMIKWIDPIVQVQQKVNVDGKVFDQSYVIDRQAMHLTRTITPTEGKDVRYYYFVDEPKEVKNFVMNSLAFGVFFEFHAYGTKSHDFPSLYLWVTELNGKDLAEVQQEVKKLGTYPEVKKKS